MLNIDNIFNCKDLHIVDKLEFGVSIVNDIEIWIEKFNNHLKEIDLAQNTIISYNIVLKALLEYTQEYISKQKSISQFNESHTNDFLLWMENYRVNRDYGSLKSRVTELLNFIKFTQKNANNDIFELRNSYLNSIEKTKKVQKVNFILDEFEDYYFENEIDLKHIDNNYIKNYIEFFPKVSNTTMIHRRAVIHKFITFIAEKAKTDKFESTLKNMKLYKKQKGTIYKSKSFEKETLNKLMNFIDGYIENPAIFKKRVRKNSQHIAYRNTAMILLMLGAGCRVSEALSIKYSDIEDTKNETYRINILNGKGNKQRTSYILKSLFKKHLEYLMLHRKNDNEYLSTNSNGVRVNRKNLYEEVRNMFKHIGEDKKGLHIFRHHFGSSFAENNGNMKILQDLLGHSVITTTMTYSAVGEIAKENAIATQLFSLSNLKED